MNYFRKYIKPNGLYFILGPLGLLMEVGGDIALPLLIADVINKGVIEGNIHHILMDMLYMAVVIILGGVGGTAGSYWSSKASMTAGSGIRQDLFEKIQTLSFQNLDEFTTGSLITRLTNDITQIQNTIMMIMRMVLRCPIMIVSAVIISFILNARLALIILIVVPVLVAVIYVILKMSYPRFDEMQKKLDKINSIIQESLVNIRVVKSFVREDFEKEKFDKANETLKDKTISAMGINLMLQPYMTLVMYIATVAVVWFGARFIMKGEMSVGDLTAFITYVSQIQMNLTMLSRAFLTGTRALTSFKRIDQVLRCEVDLNDDKAHALDKVVSEGTVEFKNVKYKYYKKRKQWVLDDISFRIEGGQTLGIIGPTGSGKSTLVALIPRLYDVDEGEILVDGVNVKDYSLYNLREGVGVVLQKNLLFSGSIMENIRWGNQQASDKQVYDVCEEAQAHTFVKQFSQGYDTQLGQGGVNVSGGQKQRLCIARALLKKPKILILDDSTSAVDTATQAKIRETFDTTLKDATKIIIAQRISSVINADKIIVIDEGKIVGSGTHTELMNSCMTYIDIFASQMSLEDAERTMKRTMKKTMEEVLD